MSEYEKSAEDSSQNDEGSDSDGGSSVNIDLTNNEIYQGVCTLFEDEDGNNILEYISLLHTELINMNKNMESVKTIKDDIHRIANAIEAFVKHTGIEVTPKKKSSSKKD